MNKRQRRKIQKLRLLTLYTLTNDPKYLKGISPAFVRRFYRRRWS